VNTMSVSAHADASMASDQLAQGHVDRLALRPRPDQLLSFVEHTVVDLDVRPHTRQDTHPRVYVQTQGLDGSSLAGLSGVQVIQVDEVTWTPGGPLHRPKMLKRAYRDRHAGHLDVYRSRSKLGIR
jgi:hypothetical protein